MRHIMHLHEEPFQKIKSGKKVIEGRLFDKKRSSLKVNDEVIFASRKTNEKVFVKIVKLEKYKDFEEMFEKTKRNLWAKKDLIKKDFVNSFKKYYSEEETEKQGALAIYFKLIK